MRAFLILVGLPLLPSEQAEGAVLSNHGPLRVLVVSDEVNPHGLGDAELTQPGDLARALRDLSAGIVLARGPEGLTEILEPASLLQSVDVPDFEDRPDGGLLWFYRAEAAL